MRTTLVLPDKLVNELMKLYGGETKTHLIILGLKELLRKKRVDKLTDLFGKIDLDIDIKKTRHSRI